MKKRNQIPCDEARLINASGDHPIDHLDSRSLDRHLENIYLFKLGLQNSFGINFRDDSYTRTDEGGGSKKVLFNYLTEVLPLIESRVKRLPELRGRAYAKLEDAAVQSFWEVYYRFQPLIHKYSQQYGVDIDDLGNVLGRTILLYEKRRGFKFYSYLEKTLRESIKNLRGRMYAEQFYLPVSAGRLMPQLLWLLDQQSLHLERRLSPEESDALVIGFLREHPAQFSEATMRTVAEVARTQVRKVSLDHSSMGRRGDHAGNLPADSEDSNPIDARDEYEHALRRIHSAFVKAGFNQDEQAILLERLDLAHDEDLYARLASDLTAGSLRNRKKRLLLRFLAALHAADAPRFGRFLYADPQASRAILKRALEDLAHQRGISSEQLIRKLLNLMSLTDSVYKLSIAERGRLELFLLGCEEESGKSVREAAVDGDLFNKLKAALMEQDHLDFPALGDP